MWKNISEGYHRTPPLIRLGLILFSAATIAFAQNGDSPFARIAVAGLATIALVTTAILEFVSPSSVLNRALLIPIVIWILYISGLLDRMFPGPEDGPQIAGWTQINPQPPPANLSSLFAVNLKDVQVVSPNVIFAVGGNGAIIRTDDFGSSWNLQDSTTNRNLFGISFLDTNEGIVVGDDGIILRTIDGGNQWNDLTPSELWSFRGGPTVPQDPDGDGVDDGDYLVVLPDNNYRLRAVHHLTPTEIVAVGGGGVGLVRAFALRSTDRGLTWADISEWSVRALKDVDFGDATSGIAVGGSFNPQVAPWLDIWYTENGGGTREMWTELENLPVEFGSPLNTVTFADTTTAFSFASKDFYLKTTTGGVSWTREPRLLPDCYGTFFYGSDFPDVNTGYVVGDFGVVLWTPDGAATWGQKPRQTRLTIPAVSFLDSQRGAIVGAGFTALTTTDGGDTWSGSVTQTLRDMYSVSFADVQNGMAVGDSGDAFRTVDGGATWTPLNPGGFSSTGAQFPLYDVDMIDPNTAVVVGVGGDWIFRTTDGGQTWTHQSVAGSFATNPLYGVSFLDTQSGVAVAHGIIIGTSDGGANWQQVHATPSPVTLRAAHFVSPTLAVVVGDDKTILRSTDGGSTWSAVAQSGISFQGNVQLLDVHFVDASTGWAVGWEPHSMSPTNDRLSVTGVILRSSDGGVSWQAQASGTELPLRGVHFSSPTVGSIVGGYGRSIDNVAQNSQQQVAVVLRTTDGSTWTEQVVPTTKNLRGVALTDNLTGVIVGGTGTILRTTNGGNP